MNKIKMLAALPVAAAAVTVALLGASPASAAAASVSVSPATGATVGSSVTVTGSGYPAGPIFLVQCATNAADGSGCNKDALGQATASASGSFTAQFKVNSKCTAGSTCYILATTATQSPTAFGSFKLAGGAASSSSAAPTSAATSSAAAAGTGSEPTAVNAGSGGHAGEQGIPTGVVLLAGAGVIGLGLGARRFARR